MALLSLRSGVEYPPKVQTDAEEDELLARLEGIRLYVTEQSESREEPVPSLFEPQSAEDELYDECFFDDPEGPAAAPSRSKGPLLPVCDDPVGLEAAPSRRGGPSLPTCDWVQVGPKRPRRTKKTQGSRPVQGPELPLKQSQRFALLDIV